MKSEDRNTKISDKNNEFEDFGLYEELELDISSKTRRKTPNKYCEWTKKICSSYIAQGLPLTAVLSTILTVGGNYISQQRYYDELLGKYITSMEELLIDDKFHYTYLKSLEQKENTNTALSADELRYKYEYEQVRSFGLSITENALRSLSKNDGFCVPYLIKYEKPFLICWYIPGTQNNPERRQLLLTFLQESKLGFIDREGQLPEQPMESFLEGINLSSISKNEPLYLTEIKLNKAILREANFTDAILRSARLTQADLRNTHLIRSDLSGAFLTKANLRNADLFKGTLNSTHLDQANLINANLKEVQLDNQTNFQGALYGCIRRTETICFYSKEAKNKLEEEAIKIEPGLDLNNLPKKTGEFLNKSFQDSIEDKDSCAYLYKDKDKSPCALYDTDLSGVDLTGAKLVDADLRKTNFTKANLKDADLTNADLKVAELTRANLIDANLKEVQLDNQTNFQGALYGCSRNKPMCFSNKIENEELKNKLEEEAIKIEPGLDLSKLSQKTREVLKEVFKTSIEDKDSCAYLYKDKSPCALYDTDLSGVDLTGAKLVGAYLRKTNFKKANLKDADLTEADLTEADLAEADLTGANLKGAKGAVINQAKLCNTIRPNGKISDCPKNDS